MDKDMPADWALERAAKLARYKTWGEFNDFHRPRGGDAIWVAKELARYIEAHEQPPVDPDLEIAREICAKVADALLEGSHAKGYRDGNYDERERVQFTLAKLKEARGK